MNMRGNFWNVKGFPQIGSCTPRCAFSHTHKATKLVLRRLLARFIFVGLLWNNKKLRLFSIYCSGVWQKGIGNYKNQG